MFSIHLEFSYCNQGFPGGASGKESACECRRCCRRGFDSWVWNILWRRKWQPTLVFLSGKSHGQRSLVGCSPWRHKDLDTTEHAHIYPLHYYYGRHINRYAGILNKPAKITKRLKSFSTDCFWQIYSEQKQSVIQHSRLICQEPTYKSSQKFPHECLSGSSFFKKSSGAPKMIFLIC